MIRNLIILTLVFSPLAMAKECENLIGLNS